MSNLKCYLVVPAPVGLADDYGSSQRLIDKVIQPVCDELEIGTQRLGVQMPTTEFSEETWEFVRRAINDADFAATEITNQSLTASMEIGAISVLEKPIVTFVRDELGAARIPLNNSRPHIIYSIGSDGETKKARDAFRRAIFEIFPEGKEVRSSEDTPPARSSISELMTAPASNRYVTTKDNQAAIDLGRTLSEIRNEFRRDHNKSDINREITLEFLAEADGTIAQIERGKVRVGQLLEGLVPAIQKVLPYLAAYPGLEALLQKALEFIQLIVESIGKA